MKNEKILEILRSFLLIKDIGDAIITSIVELSELFDLDRISIYIRNDVESEFKKLINYNYREEVDMPDAIDILSKFSNLNINNQELNKIEDNLINVFDGDTCYITNNFKDVASVFYDAGYDTNADNVLSFATHYIKVEDNFIYITFEKQKVRDFNNKKNGDCLTKEDIKYINMFCEMLQIRLEREEYFKLVST